MNCPNCHSHKVKPGTPLWVVWLAVSLVSFLVPVFGWIVAPGMLLALPFIYVAERKKHPIKCLDCDHHYMIDL